MEYSSVVFMVLDKNYKDKQKGLQKKLLQVLCVLSTIFKKVLIRYYYFYIAPLDQTVSVALYNLTPWQGTHPTLV